MDNSPTFQIKQLKNLKLIKTSIVIRDSLHKKYMHACENSKIIVTDAGQHNCLQWGAPSQPLHYIER